MIPGTGSISSFQKHHSATHINLQAMQCSQDSELIIIHADSNMQVPELPLVTKFLSHNTMAVESLNASLSNSEGSSPDSPMSADTIPLPNSVFELHVLGPHSTSAALIAGFQTEIKSIAKKARCIFLLNLAKSRGFVNADRHPHLEIIDMDARVNCGASNVVRGNRRYVPHVSDFPISQYY